MEYHIPDQFMSYILLAKKMDSGNRLYINLKSPWQVYSMQAFQNGRFVSPEIPSQRKQPCLQDRSARCLFQCHYVSVSSRKFVRFAWSVNIYKFLCPFLVSFQHFFKTVEGTNSSTKGLSANNFLHA